MQTWSTLSGPFRPPLNKNVLIKVLRCASNPPFQISEQELGQVRYVSNQTVVVDINGLERSFQLLSGDDIEVTDIGA